MTWAMHLIPIIYFPNFEHYNVEYSNVVLSDLPLLGEKSVSCGGFTMKKSLFLFKR